MRYIDADKLIDDIRPFAEYDSNRSNKDWVRRFEIAIDAQPTADVRENVKGEWLHDEVTMNGNTVYTPNAKCSICDCYVFQESDFCPNCGAEMQNGEDNE